MPKRRSGGRDGGRTAKRRRQHLYLVLDDWSCGYSIRKLDLLDSDSEDDAAEPADLKMEGAELRLPPAVFRLKAPRGLPHYFASAFGTRIMALHPREPGTDGKMLLGPVFDVRSRGIIFGPWSKAKPSHPIYIPVRDRLFCLADGSFELLWPPPPEHPGHEHWVWSWCELPRPPFERQHVTSYAVHPDGRTILISTGTAAATAATFAFDTEAPFFVWRRHGEWTLPFTGRAHFDCELDSFVGLSKDPDTLGHLYSCDASPVSSQPGDVQCPAPAKKLSKEKLFGDDPAETYVGATLVYVGSRSKFCLVQCISIEDDCNDEELEEKDAPRPCRRLFRLTMFSLIFDKNGDLTAGKSRRVRYYRVPKACTEVLLTNPVAFWL